MTLSTETGGPRGAGRGRGGQVGGAPRHRGRGGGARGGPHLTHQVTQLQVTHPDPRVDYERLPTGGGGVLGTGGPVGLLLLGMPPLGRIRLPVHGTCRGVNTLNR